MPIVIGVGGFLGMGEHQVAMPWDRCNGVDQPIEHRVSGDRPTTTGRTTRPASGTSTAPADSTTTTTTTDPKTGATRYNHDRQTSGSSTADRSADRAANRTDALRCIVRTMPLSR